MDIVAKELPPRNWRTEEMHNRYHVERQSVIKDGSCPMCTAPSIGDYTHWRIVQNLYPYDGVAARHDLLVIKRHTGSDRELTVEEREELFTLKETTLNSTYAMMIEALPKNRSIPGHFHIHLIVPKPV